MAITNQGARNLLPSAQLPSGYTVPTVAGFVSDSNTYCKTIDVLVLKATVEAATAALTMAAIFNNATIGINKQIADIVAADFIATKTVTSYGELIALSTNAESVNFSDQTYLTNTAVSYKCKVKIYVKSA